VTNRFLWAVAVIIVLVVGLGAWAILERAPTTPSGYATITGIAGKRTLWAAGTPAGTSSGIENVYIVTHGAVNENINLSGNANLLGVITSSGGSCSIPYETSFDIVVAVKAGTDNMAYARIDNMNVGLQISGSFSAAEENAQTPGHSTTNCRMATYSWDNNGYGTTSGYLQINAIWDNNGNGWKLPAGGSITLGNIELWGWK
jgi:hypothetical protein